MSSSRAKGLILCTECEDIATQFSTCDLVVYCVTLTALGWKSVILDKQYRDTNFFVEPGVCGTRDVYAFPTQHVLSETFTGKGERYKIM